MSGDRPRTLRRLARAWLCPLGWGWPRDPRLWVFGAWHGRRYADNARYLYRYVRDHQPDLRAVWLADDEAVVRQVRAEGGAAVMAYSRAGIHAALRAGVCLVTHGAEDANAEATLGGLLVNLTHGTPLKRQGHDVVSSMGAGRRPLSWRRLPGLTVVASRTGRERVMSAYGLPGSTVLTLGYPRWDGFAENAHGLLRRLGVEPRDHAGIVLYAPTGRRLGHSRLDVTQGGRLAALGEWLQRERLMLLVRDATSLSREEREVLVSEARMREISVSALGDIQPLLPAVDMLITDYSSLMYDYACLERPIILMAPDLEDYLEHDVGLYGDYLADAPGPVIGTWDQLPVAWRDVMAGRYAVRLARFAGNHAEWHDGQACPRIIDAIKRRLGLPPVPGCGGTAPGATTSRRNASSLPGRSPRR
ncbi:CDP-glycerol glycerophosphotransferase family protein [Halomonas organivorans]|uniref:CDP-glycerol glycerophosphotransferase (TagB/SpsB family) n=1 Tax=Halomonas organivorans TaxID=257772 RepID=A0A7W5BYZ9_9GAMM|nr:CDP-glycerol glycerophosphotransferase family protein [Halomonas organivorans]MBB3140788.1 CDP-glycerol glycerophosphotransferase (TagB/SpsB family) [Halomonas organivorans]